MNNYRSDRGRRDDRGSFRGRSSDRGRREMFDAVCSNCGKACQIPFQPRNDKPVYCSDCFEKMGGNDRRDSDRRSGGRDSRRGSSGGFDGKEIEKLSRGIEAMNTKLDKVISLLSPSDDQSKIKQENLDEEVVEEKPAEVIKTSKKTLKKTVKKEEKEDNKEEESPDKEKKESK